MYPHRPGRIRGFTYVGRHRYSLTICTARRKPVFTDASVVESVMREIRKRGEADRFAILAYCFMPDHVHLLVEGITEGSDLRPFMAGWKQTAGFYFKRTTGDRLWQDSYYDHVLRDDEETWRAARYILENPVRKGLVASFEDYPFSGSDMFTAQQLRALWDAPDRAKALCHR